MNRKVGKKRGNQKTKKKTDSLETGRGFRQRCSLIRKKNGGIFFRLIHNVRFDNSISLKQNEQKFYKK